MNGKTLVPIHGHDLAKALAYSSCHDQARVLNDFSNELRIACRDEQSFDQQCNFIAEQLDSHGMRLVERITDFMRLRAEAPDAD